MNESTSEVVRSGQPCPCGRSSDAFAIYSDGHGHCFSMSCEKPHYPNVDDPEATTPRTTKAPLAKGLVRIERIVALANRRLSEETCRLFGYGIGEVFDKPVQIAPYYDPRTGEMIAQKLRFAGKEFSTVGDIKHAGLFGQHLWRDGGKKIVITEGELDAMSMSQAMGNKWPVVSIPSGAQGAAKALQKQLEWLEKFESVILMFDNDEPGRLAVQECADLFTPGKCKIATLPLKDASEMLQQGRVKDLVDAMWSAKEFRPDGIVNAADLLDLILTEDDTMRFPYPWKAITDFTYGFKLGDVVVVTAGSGTGKTAFVSEISYDLGYRQNVKVGLLKLEEPIRRTAIGILGLHLNKRIHRQRPGEAPPISKEDLAAAHREVLSNGNFFLYDHFGSTVADTLLAKIRFLAKGCDCKVIILDHISIAVSGSLEDDERRLLDRMMTSLKTLAVECNVTIFVVSHLRRPEGDKGHEDGAQTRLGQLRGSHAIGQLADFVIGLERNQQHDTDSNITNVRVLKDRDGGETGLAGHLQYDKETGRLTELSEDDPSPF